MASTHRNSSEPILLLAARPSAVQGSFEGTVTVHAATRAEAERLVESFYATLRPIERWDTDAFTYGSADLSRRDPLRATASAHFSRVAKDALLQRAPLSIPSRDMWRAALDAHRGFGEGATDWLVDRVFSGAQEPDRLVIDVAYRLLAEENARRAKLR